MKDSTQKNYAQAGVICLIILAAIAFRFLPVMHNFSPLAAIGLFAAAHMPKKSWALMLPIGAAWLSDILLNNFVYTNYYPEFTLFAPYMIWTFASYLLIVLAGFLMLRKVSAARVIGSSLTATAIFYLVTNFGSWIGNPMYTQDFSGLMTCMAAGIPFIKGTLIGDLMYSGVFFGGYALLQKYYPQLKKNFQLS